LAGARAHDCAHVRATMSRNRARADGVAACGNGASVVVIPFNWSTGWLD
jgi:hypothetical protein